MTSLPRSDNSRKKASDQSDKIVQVDFTTYVADAFDQSITHCSNGDLCKFVPLLRISQLNRACHRVMVLRLPQQCNRRQFLTDGQEIFNVSVLDDHDHDHHG